MSTALQFLERNQHQIWFFLLSVILFAVSLAIAFLGVLYGAHVLQALNADGKIELATMGELLGGTLGVAVAFAGAWVAFKIASFANETLVLQERREASRLANETMEKSIGKILEVQLHFEALLRHIEHFAIGDDPATASVETLSKRERSEVESSRKKVSDSAGALSLGVQEVLTNPLAISVLIALQENRPEKKRTQQQRMLADLSQIPRKMDQLRALVESRHPVQGFANPLMPALVVRCIFNGFEDQKQPLDQLTKVGLALENLTDYATMTRLSPLKHLAEERVGLVGLYELREEFLLLAMRYFIYTPDEAQKAIDNVLSEMFYRDPEARNSILNGRPAKAFYSSGDITDESASFLLDASSRVQQALSSVFDTKDMDSAATIALRRIVISSALVFYKKSSQFASQAKEHEAAADAPLRGVDEYDDALYKNIKWEDCDLDELEKESRGLSAYQIYCAAYLALQAISRTEHFTWPTAIIQNFRKLHSGLTLRAKLLQISEEFSSQRYARSIEQVVEVALDGRALPELDALKLSAEDWGDGIPEPLVLQDIIFERLNRQLAATILRDLPEDEQRSLISWLVGTRSHPFAIRSACTAYRKYKAVEAPLVPADVYLATCFAMLRKNDNRSLCVTVEALGLQADLGSGIVQIADPTTGLQGDAGFTSLEERPVILMKFRMPSGFALDDLQRAIHKAGVEKTWRSFRADDGTVWMARAKYFSPEDKRPYIVELIKSILLTAQPLYKLALSASASIGQDDDAPVSAH
jgi:hypothetical protein